MTQEVINRWAEINKISFLEAAREIKILITMYPNDKKASAATETR